VAHSSKRPFAIWLTGLPASGKSTVRKELVKLLETSGIRVAVLESDALRKSFSEEPRYGALERDFFYRSIAFIGRTLVEHGISVIFDATANRRDYRQQARQAIPEFVEVFVDTPLEVCMARDPKGIYRQAREGKAEFVPGLQAEYEPPLNPEIVVRGDIENPEDAARRIMAFLQLDPGRG
jgi:adenylylsulfate kinase